MAEQRSTAIRLLAVITFLLVVAGLKWSYPVTMPLAVAVFVIAAVWPVKPALDRVMPSALSYVGTVLVLGVVLVGFAAATYLAVAEVVRSLTERQDQFRQLYDAYAAWAERNDFPVQGGNDGYARLLTLAQAVFANTYTVTVYFGSIAILVLLGLPEVPAMGRKIRAQFDRGDSREMLDVSDQIAARFRTYVGVTALGSLITGVACALWAFALGLELALTWGLLNFLLNFIPVIGNIIGIIPPALYAVVQFQGWTMPIVVFVGYAVIQIVISNFVSPWLQGQGLSLSPVVVVLALGFWGWVWGIAGALLAVPLTSALVIVCDRFDSTRWAARLLSQG